VNPSAKYLHFASNVSFFDFPAELPEFKKLRVRQDLETVTGQLQTERPWDAQSLSGFVRANPGIFEVIARIFQQERFSNAQLTYFAFDVTRLNSEDIDVRYNYAIEEVRRDSYCEELFSKQMRQETDSFFSMDELFNDTERFTKETVAACFKITVSEYVLDASETFEHLSDRLRDPTTKSSDRFAKYVVEVLQLNEFLDAIDAKKFVAHKLIPTDSKGRHGKFARNKVQRILEESGFQNLGSHLKKAGLDGELPKTLDLGSMNLDPGKKYYCMEKFVEGIRKRKGGKLKKFDFIIFVEGRPKHLFEVNFYSTSGTKIDINKGEYRSLNALIKENGNSQFHWITDGNYWLTAGGKGDFEELIEEYFDIYNINTFKESLKKFTL
jgi:hypothetical protein